MDDPTLCSTFWGAPGAFKDTSRSAQRQPKSTKERPRTLNDSHRAPNNHQDHTRHAQVSPKVASIAGNTTKTHGFSTIYKTNQSVLKGPQGAPIDSRGHPKTSQEVPEDPQGAPKGSQGRPTALPRTPQDTEDVPRHPQSSPRTAQGPPKNPKDSKEMPKEPNGASKDLQNSQKSPKFIEQ